jgi:predicted transcriptional regulator YdeE
MIFNVKDIDEKYSLSVKAKSFPEGVKEAFDVLEGKLRSLKGKKFFGVSSKGSGGIEYRACAVSEAEGESFYSGFEMYKIPGGKYATCKIEDWADKLEEIGPLFKEMGKNFNLAESRPLLEFYRSQKELILMMPIK